ncbi:MAG: hypothetical protein NT099_04085 [Candidatus Saganbacteria bacterium]|nr:hypothetical protein [Candidatus Saganbacteria bacterium]
MKAGPVKDAACPTAPRGPVPPLRQNVRLFTVLRSFLRCLNNARIFMLSGGSSVQDAQALARAIGRSSLSSVSDLVLYGVLWQALHVRDEKLYQVTLTELEQRGIKAWLIESEGVPLTEWYPGAEKDFPIPIDRPFAELHEDPSLENSVRQHAESCFKLESEEIILAIGHLIDNIHQHAVRGYGVILVKPLCKDDGKKGVEIVSLDDGVNLGGLKLSEEVKPGKGRPKGQEGGMGLFYIGRLVDEFVIISKRQDASTKVWSSEYPQREDEAHTRLAPSGRITICWKWFS